MLTEIEDEVTLFNVEGLAYPLEASCGEDICASTQVRNSLSGTGLEYR